MKGKAVKDKIITWSFIIIIILPIINMNHQRGKISITENRYLAEFPQIFDDKGKLNVGLKGSFENWFNDNIGFREPLIKLSSSIQYNIFHKSPTEKVEIGKSGWFFYTLDNNIEIAQGKYMLSEEMLKEIAIQQEEIRKKLNEQGIEYILILPPSKVSIYPEMIASGNYSIRKTPVDIVADYLEQNTQVKVVRLKEALLEGKDKQQLYFKTDTHWNEAGAYVAYSEIINKLIEWKIIETEPTQVKMIPSTYKGEFSAMMGNIDLLPEEETLNTEIISQKAQKIESGDKKERLQQMNSTLGINMPIYLYQNTSVKDVSAVFFGDSMFGSWNATELLAENFKELTYIWDYNIRQEWLDELKPDVVFYDMGERYLNSLVTKSQEFHKDELVNPKAEIISHDAPKIIDRESTYTIHITVKNTGSESWREQDEVRLCIWQDGLDLGYRIKLPKDVIVEPNEEYTFVLEGFGAPPSSHTYLEFQMLQEGITYFGEKYRVDITINEN